MNFNKEKLQQILLYNLNQEIEINIFDRLDSTNDKLGEILGEKIPNPVVAIALQQTAGKGQWGRKWESKIGGLYLSLGLGVNIPLKDSFHLTLFSVLGIAKKLRQEGIEVGIKWPNDIILEGKKLGGIKTEISSKNELIKKAIIGVGINNKNPVPETGINLDKYNISLEKLAEITIEGIILGYRDYLELGIDEILENYLKLFINLGQEIQFEGNKGRIIGISKKGELKVKLNSKGATTIINLPIGSISLGYN